MALVSSDVTVSIAIGKSHINHRLHLSQFPYVASSHFVNIGQAGGDRPLWTLRQVPPGGIPPVKAPRRVLTLVCARRCAALCRQHAESAGSPLPPLTPAPDDLGPPQVTLKNMMVPFGTFL